MISKTSGFRGLANIFRHTQMTRWYKSSSSSSRFLGPAVDIARKKMGKNVGKPGKMQETRGKNMFEWERIISSIMGKKMGNYHWEMGESGF